MDKDNEIKKINRDALIARLISSKELFIQFDNELMTADNSVVLAYKLGEWKNTIQGVIKELIQELDKYDE